MGKHESFGDALAAFQAELGPIAKNLRANAGKFSYTYASLDAILDQIRPLMVAHGLAHTATPYVTETGAWVMRVCLLWGGQVQASAEWPLTTTLEPRERGIEITYARRYLLNSLLGIHPEDDTDGAITHARRAARQDGDGLLLARLETVNNIDELRGLWKQAKTMAARDKIAAKVAKLQTIGKDNNDVSVS